MEWVCRETTYFRSKLWTPGETVEVISDSKWIYNGGGWVQDGAKVVDVKKGEFISRFFEPVNFSCLLEPTDIHRARVKEFVPRTWLYTHEVPREKLTPVEQMPPPKPLKPEELRKPRAEKQKIAPGRVQARPSV